jgi:hypothetical protein
MRSGRAFGGKPANLREGRRLGDDVIDGKRDDQGIAFALGGKSRAGCNGRTGIAPYRFQHDIGFDSDRGELFGDQEAILIVGHDERTAEQSWIRNAADRVLECRMRTEHAGQSLVPAPPHMIKGVIVLAMRTPATTVEISIVAF